MRNARLEEAQGGIKIARRNINNLRYADDTTRMAESEEELKSLLMKGEWKSWPKAQHSENEESSRSLQGARQRSSLAPYLRDLWPPPAGAAAPREPSPEVWEYIMRNAGLKEAQAEIKIAGRNINNLRYTDDTTLLEESKEELKSLLMRVKQESEKTGLKLNIQKTKIMESGPITSCK